MELLKVDTLEEAMEKLKNFSASINPTKEKVNLENGLGRVLAENVVSKEDIPGFCRSTVDGFAVRASDIQGAGEGIPTFLEIKGKVEMGKEPHFSPKKGESAYVATGAMLPQGTDAVVMEEYCEEFTSNLIAVYMSVGAGTNVVQHNEDVKKDERVLIKGRRLRPQDMGLLASMGCTEIQCYKPWSIYIISTGDELVSPEAEAGGGKVRDVNTYGLMGLAMDMGFEIKGRERTGDSREKLTEAICRGKEQADLVVVSGGSSKGNKDITAELLDGLSSSGVFTHGIAVKPGKPTILAVDEPSRTVMIGLPGHPVAALILFKQLVGGLWKVKTQGEESPFAIAVMDTNLPSAPGRKTFQLVSLTQKENLIEATPVLGKSGIISSMSKADGYVIIDRDQEGIKKGGKVKVYFI